MANVVVSAGGTRTINQSGTDQVSFAGLGTLDVTGQAGNPIDVTLSQVGGVGALDTINVSDAAVTVGGIAGVSALVRYNIGSGGTLDLASTLGVSAGTDLAFTAPDSRLMVGNGVDLSLLSGISGFGPGSSIDVSDAATSVSYDDADGTDTGGTLTLRDNSGNTVSVLHLLTGDFTDSSFTLVPDGNGGTIVGFTPIVTSLTAAPATAVLDAGRDVTLTASTNQPVTVTGGTPTLALNDGGLAVYDPTTSTPTSLVFRYTVAPGQNTADLAVTSLNLNGATVAGVGGDVADLAGAIGNPSGTLQIDTLAPSVSGTTLSPSSGDLDTGQTVTIGVTSSEAVTVAGGTPTLNLNDGAVATYDAAASTPTDLVFTYTVAAGQNTPDLAIDGSALNGATITDAAGNQADLSGVVGNPAGTLQIDTTPPTVSGVATTPSSGDLDTGQTVTFGVTSSEAVTVAGGTPTLNLNDGAVATYDAAASTPTDLVFTYTVAAGQNTPDLAIDGSALNGATITDAAGNQADLSGVVGNPAGTLQIDTTPPTVSGVATTPAVGDGQPTSISVGLSEPVAVAGGTPTLTLSNGGTATYDPSASTPSNLVFAYAPRAGGPDGLNVSAVNLNSASVTDGAGNAVDFAGAFGNPPLPQNYAVTDTTTGASFYASGTTYDGPAAGLQHEYINTSPDNLNIAALVPNSFIHSGSGMDAIDVSGVSGTNVLDGSTGSNFLVGGAGDDTFFVDDRSLASDIWSTLANFHSGDVATIWGIIPSGYALNWNDDQGRPGIQG